MSKKNNVNFLMAPMSYDACVHSLEDFYIAPYLNGVRCFWDGGLTRDQLTESVPWANIYYPAVCTSMVPILPKATGLWSDRSEPIKAPDWWLNKLPCLPLDGTLYNKDNNLEDWSKVEFAIHACPPFENIFSSRIIDNMSLRLEISLPKIVEWVKTLPESLLKDYRFLKSGASFEEELECLRDSLPPWDDNLYLLKHKRILTENYEDVIDRELWKATAEGFRGLLLRRAKSNWTPNLTTSFLEITV
jgi:hypothetical protein